MTSIFNYRRRRSSEVEIGNVPLGGGNPIRKQSMTSTSTDDVEGSVAQSKRIFDAGADYVRLTAQGVKEAEAIGKIREELHLAGYCKPLVADIHFNPRAAFAAAEVTDKVRINPGNFVDAARTFKKLEFTDEEYQKEIERIREKFIPFLEICKEHKTAIRLGVNHGSLSDRIMSRYGDTPSGMVESVMEFLRICREVDFNNVVISIKASNTVVMVETVRLLVSTMDSEGMSYPLHLGVTEAGDGEDGRIKSAVGIGALLSEGLGDTIRVSLSEEPELEIPVAKKLVDYIACREGHAEIKGDCYPGYNHICPERRPTDAVGIIGGTNHPIVVSSIFAEEVAEEEFTPDFHCGDSVFVEADASECAAEVASRTEGKVILLRSHHVNAVGEIQAFIHALTAIGNRTPIVVAMSYDDTVRYSFAILQAVRQRISKTEFISCPSCGRTLFNLQETVKTIKAATSHLKGLKIGIMGCIVNGPGEMADADYGYVGAAAGKVSLYKNKECIERNIPQEQALERLIQIMKENGDWIEK